MSIWFIVAIIPTSALFAMMYAAFRRDRKIVWPIVISLIILALSVTLFIYFSADKKEILVSEETEIQSTQKLQQIIIDEDEKYYLVQNGGIFQFSYIDDYDGLVTKSVEIQDSKVFYDVKDKGICLIIRKITKTYNDKWAFIESEYYSKTVYEYDFYIPDRDNIYYLYENNVH